MAAGRAAQAAGEIPRDKGRLYVGSSEGEALQANFRPPWARGPDLGAVVGSGPVQDKVRDALAAKKVSQQADRVDFLGFAILQAARRARARARAWRAASGCGAVQARLLDWGMKMILTRVLSPVQFLGYQFQLAKVRAAPRAARRVASRAGLGVALREGRPASRRARPRRCQRSMAAREPPSSLTCACAAKQPSVWSRRGQGRRWPTSSPISIGTS